MFWPSYHFCHFTPKLFNCLFTNIFSFICKIHIVNLFVVQSWQGKICVIFKQINCCIFILAVSIVKSQIIKSFYSQLILLIISKKWRVKVIKFWLYFFLVFIYPFSNILYFKFKLFTIICLIKILFRHIVYFNH